MLRFSKLAVPALCLLATLLPAAADAQTAHYTVTFDATWSAATHPTDFPPSPHFSGLVGGNHNGDVSFWNAGELASLGIKRMAEWGSQTELLAEFQTAITAGMAEATVVDDPLWTVPGSTSVDMSLSPSHPLVTLVAMIAPSPDWFVGVSGLDLRPGDIWATEIVVEVYPIDAGTDSGPSYTSPDQVTNPPVPVFAITGYPFSPGVPIGTLTFTLNGVADVPSVGAFTATAFPNPFNPRTTIAWEMPRAGDLRIDLFDVAGRRVRNLRTGEAAAGAGSVVWNGLDASGRTAAAGVYFAFVQTGSAREVIKLTLVK